MVLAPRVRQGITEKTSAFPRRFRRKMGPRLRGDDDADASSVMLAPVYWILAAVFIVIALTRPRLRPLGVVGCIILGAMLAWGMVQRLRGEDPSQAPAAQQRGKPASPAVA